MNTLVVRPTRVRTAGVRQQILLTAQQRLMILMLLFAAAFFLVSVRLVYFALFDPSSSRGAATAFIPARADIVDRNGVPLARTIDGYSIRVVPSKLLNNRQYLADELHKIFPDMSREDLLAKLSGSRPTYIRRRALPDQVAAVNAIGDVGFDFPREKERLYPQLSLAAHVLGFTNAEGHGVTGVEGAFDQRLTDKATRGQPLALSIDARVQGVLESELSAAVANLEAIGGAGVILDVHTGEVAAMTSLPTFNPNKLTGSDPATRRNAVTYNLYELGSTFKPLSIGAAIDDGVVTNMARRYDATAPLPIAGFRIRDSHPGRWYNVPETLIESSNIATARIADELGRENLERLFRNLDFDKRPEIDLKERAFPLWPKDWGRVTTMTTSYGHGIAVTPMHLASAYAALVNGGIYRPATLMKLGDKAPPQGRRVFKATTSARMRQLLRLIVSDGTGKQANAAGFRVGGKTGSAEKPGAGGYRRHSLVSTFSAAFPMDNPRYVVIVMIDEPKGNAYSSGQRTAGWTAAPVVRKVVTRAGPMLGVFPDESRDVDVSELTPLLRKGEESH
ncbi:peptidoglycan D,D-transpeptidase FtsI family protein [Sphingopyxis sp. RIFCSPHIGHO2_12_FULL_65_19]|uniref:peptidoglycan D,D-transpeptidase FtsI family protein n=1 Tax=Sphingopyxis sp. RIFCSPHIGHO2_12_FULL_65_19 TaxID=1802172 RepID=UPI0008C5864F|nr:penicillin-binding protein 2 [Sphingopyxis sp. RIFCSPHIGHO2_12_FULL_65_19]OHD10180.1 MAG: peptidoglycan glycosyltransferase [Sphingopyxis sp. RIFCSPHIGHO2_12_FULL_65_19]